MYGGYSEQPPEKRQAALSIQELPTIDFSPELADEAFTCLLPHEYKKLVEYQNMLLAQQKNLGEHLGEAMDQSSETFHDNAPQEAVVAESVILAKRAEPVVRTLGNFRIARYPEPDSTIATLGSRLVVSLDERPSFTLQIVGVSWLYEEVEDVEFVSYTAPLAKILLGHSVSDKVNTVINERSVSIVVHDIQQVIEE